MPDRTKSVSTSPLKIDLDRTAPDEPDFAEIERALKLAMKHVMTASAALGRVVDDGDLLPDQLSIARELIPDGERAIECVNDATNAIEKMIGKLARAEIDRMVPADPLAA